MLKITEGYCLIVLKSDRWKTLSKTISFGNKRVTKKKKKETTVWFQIIFVNHLLVVLI